jgi:2-amino-4-hydroxy-6-hydroxymethyldihydropteridine diphosphokinase
MNAWIGLGGNFPESETLIGSALAYLGAHEKIIILRESAIYRSPPWGLSEQAEFANAVAEIETSIPALELMNLMLDLENRLGRDRQGIRWGPRCIDLDLLTFGNLELETASLELPHPRMHLRAFVLKPILDLEPNFEIPGIGKAQLALDQLAPQEVRAVHVLRPLKQDTDL